jgi:hypothetical protein
MEVSADVLLRALAIIMVTYNHAHPYPSFAPGWGGGMTFLMMLSGYNFAKFGMQGATAGEGRRALLRLGAKIFIPSLIAVLFFFVLLRKFNLEELLFYRNWLTVERVAKFPTWYPQVIVQMFAALLLLFCVPRVAEAIFRNPLRSSLVIFGVATLIRIVCPQIWDTTTLRNFLPHLFLWNFTLGWVIYFSMLEIAAPWNKVTAIACACIGAWAGWGYDRLDFWWLSIGVVLLVLPLKLRLWTPLARFIFIVSQATFGIFLLHRFVYEVYEHAPLPPNDNAEWLVGLFGSIALWMAGAVPLRAFRALRQQAARAPLSVLKLPRPAAAQEPASRRLSTTPLSD